MGGKDEKEIRSNIRNVTKFEVNEIISNKIENFTIHLNEIIYQGTLSSTNFLVNMIKNNSKAKAAAEELLKDVTLIASSGVRIDLKQDANAQLEMAAIMQILSIDSTKDEIIGKVIRGLDASIKSEPEFKDQIIQAGRINEMAKKKGGFDKMIDSLVDKLLLGLSKSTIKSLLEKSFEQNSILKERSRMTRELENEINNTVVNQDNFISSIRELIKNEIKSLTTDTCLSNAKTRNMEAKLKLLSDGEPGVKIKVLEIAKTDAIAKCISTKNIGRRALPSLPDSFEYNPKSKEAIGDIYEKYYDIKNKKLEITVNKNIKVLGLNKDIEINRRLETKSVDKMAKAKEESKMIEMTNKKFEFKVENKKIVIDMKILNDKQKKVLDFINKKGVYRIKINKRVLFKTLKLEEITSADTIKNLNNQYKMMAGFHSMILPQLLEMGLYSKLEENKISFFLPQFMLQKDGLEENINAFFNLIKPKEDPNNDTAIMIKNIVIKFFTRLNRDNKGKHIFANMVDSIVKLGITFFLPIVMSESKKLNQMALLSNVEYFSDFIIENMVTLVSDRCRLNSVKKDLLINGSSCTPKKLVDECPKCPELKCPSCPKPVCPTPSCPEIPQPSCPEIPQPSCPEIPQPSCPEIPAPICPKPNLNVYYGIIGALVLIVIIILFTRKSVTKIVKK